MNIHAEGSALQCIHYILVVQYRKTFLRRLCALGFLNKANAPTPEAAESLPTDLESPSDESKDCRW